MNISAVRRFIDVKGKSDARHIGRDIMALLRNIVGGEITDYTKLLAESREQSLDRMVADAQRLGANAVVEVRFATSVLMGGAAELLAYGTAVVVEDEELKPPTTQLGSGASPS